MITRLLTYEVASFIHDTVWQRNDLLTDELLAASSLRRALGHSTNTEQVLALGRKRTEEPAFETLTKGRNGLYYFHATVGPEYVGELSLGRHVIATSNDEKIAARFAQSLMVREFLRLTEELAL